jgi:glucosyl-dolichyl phosphate glucuronosyltransferase
MIRISAVICTFKRPDYLRLALRSLCEQTLASDAYEIVVVDNAADPDSERVAREFSKGRGNLRYVVEEQVGLSHARNTGTQSAQGQYVAYMDDDARADPHWLESLLFAFEHVSPAPAAIGGRVWLDWQGVKPAWVSEHYLSLFTYVDHGDSARFLGDEYLVGANLAFDKQALLKLGGFDANLGRKGSSLRSGEETALLQQLQATQRGVYYEPAALVWHSVDSSRKRPGWLVRRVFWDGASQPFLERPELLRPANWRSAVTDLRQCGRWAWTMLVALLLYRRHEVWESVLGLCQRAGRLRTHLGFMVGTMTNRLTGESRS